MSHFTVMVIGEDVDLQLAPYDENEIMERYVSATKAELIAKTREDISWVAENSYKEYKKNPKDYINKSNNAIHITFLEKEFPQRLTWTDEECHAYAIENYEPHELGPDGEAYSTYNPNSKWDWYQIGGRWAGSLHLTEECVQLIKSGKIEPTSAPDFAWCSNEEEKERVLKEPRVDSTLKKFVDMEKMMAPKIEKAELLWDGWHNSPVKNLKEGDPKLVEWITQNMGHFVSRKEVARLQDMSREEYIKCMSLWSPYTLLWEGVWYEKGTMGWWGLSSEEEDDWNEQFQELWKELPDDSVITMVDCHI